MNNLHLFVTHDVAGKYVDQVAKFAERCNSSWSFFASGGSLAPLLYKEPFSKQRFNQGNKLIEIFLGDERVVNPQSSDSHAQNVRENLFSISKIENESLRFSPPFNY